MKYLVRSYGNKDGVPFEKILPFHRCEESDWALFAPPAKGHKDRIDLIKENPKRGMFCLDWEPDELMDLELYGDENNKNFMKLEVLFLPCNYLHTYFGYTDDSIHPDCIADRQA